jgi:8-hydroxy-5-deazaflavin:NADPH oxidoreductase
MRIAVLGTGEVGRALAGRLAEVGHEVVVGTRDPDRTRAREDVAGWLAERSGVGLVTNAEAGAHAEVLVNATNGSASLAALADARVGDHAGLVVLDVANVLEFAAGEAYPGIGAAVDHSLAEQLQDAFPAARVVKALNTMNCRVMVDPARVPGEHVTFVASADDGAKATVRGLLADLGWPEHRVLDLGALSAARATEMYIPLWLSLFRAAGTADVNIAVCR